MDSAITTSSISNPVVAVDLDEVLASFACCLAEFHNDFYSEYNGKLLTVDSFTSYQFHEVWGGSIEECNKKVDRFFESTHFRENLKPLPGAFEVLLELKNKYDLHIVTARQHKIEEITRQWIAKYFPGIFIDLHFGNHYSTEGKVRSKAEICKSIGAKVLIDDSPNYTAQCAREGIHSFLFGHYPWNQTNSFQGGDIDVINYVDSNSIIAHASSDSSSTRVYRFQSWKMVQEALDYLFSRKIEVESSSSASAPSDVTNLNRSMNKSELRVAVIQMCSTNDKVANINTISRLVKEACAQGSHIDVVCLPECAIFMGNSAQETFKEAEMIEDTNKNGILSANSYAFQALSEIARDSKVWLSVGGFPQLSDASSVKMTNTHFILDREGKMQLPFYQKIHLFDCPLVGLQESKLTDPGNRIVSIDIEGWKIGLAVCYDLRFPALFEALRCDSGAHAVDAILVPSAFTVPTGKAHWEVLLRARAIENQCYIIAAAQSGQHNERRCSFGHSMIINPWGSIESQLHSEQEGVVTVTMSRETIQDTRRKMPVQEHRRPDIYL